MDKMKEIISFLESSRTAFLDDLAALVNGDCGTYSKAGVDRMGEWVSARCKEWDWAIERFPQTQYGDCWLARIRGAGGGRLMLIGHLDTVYPDGTAAVRPMKIDGARVLGPGTSDMKGGLLVGMYALRALQHIGWRDFAEIVFFFNSEEEIGSPVSRPLYSQAAREMDAAFVLEAARANGDIVSARKGSGQFTVRVKGKAAHAGVEPEKGANAVLELAHQIIALHKLNGIAPGVTVNAGVIGGGIRSNVVPEEARALVDVRAVDPAGVEKIRRAIAEMNGRTTVAGTQVEIEGGFDFQPMTKTPAIAYLVELAQAVVRELGFEVKDAATGGASDANTLAALGVPVLDGLGPIGGLDHSPAEYIEAGSIVPRAALLAGLIQRVLAQREQLRHPPLPADDAR